MPPKLAQKIKEKEPLTYEESIRKITFIHKTIEFGFSKNEFKDKEELYELLSDFYDHFCVVTCEIPGNELRKAYSETEIGFKIVAMPLKVESGEYQNADYAFLISINGDKPKRLKIRFERKEASDFNGTILYNWKRFMDELSNSKDEDFRIVVEGGMFQTLTLFRSYPKKCKYCENVGYRIKEEKRNYYCKIDGKERAYNYSCGKLILKKRSDKKILQLVAFKRKRIGIIEAMGFPIVWADYRENAAKYINASVKNYFIVHYAEVLDL